MVSVTVCAALAATAAPTPRDPKETLGEGDSVADGVSVTVVVVPSSLVNCSCSMFQSVSMPSLTFWLTAERAGLVDRDAAVGVRGDRVLPRGARKTAVSQFFGVAEPQSPARGPPGRISRTI